MPDKAVLLLAAIATAVTVTVVLCVAIPATPDATLSPAPAEVATKPVTSIGKPAVTFDPARSATVGDPVARYLAMRDDGNPVPRLAFIEEAARTRQTEDTAELLAYAMVDPDERVRSRAQELIDQAMASPTRRSE